MKWLEPWHYVGDDPKQVDGLAKELSRELAAGHVLHGLPMRAVARRQYCDDVLFAIEDGTGRVAVVHLTWIQNRPEVPPYPSAVIYPSLDGFVIEGMQPDANEFGT